MPQGDLGFVGKCCSSQDFVYMRQGHLDFVRARQAPPGFVTSARDTKAFLGRRKRNQSIADINYFLVLSVHHTLKRGMHAQDKYELVTIQQIESKL